MKHVGTVLKEFDTTFWRLVTARSVSMLPRFTTLAPWLAYSGNGPRMTFEYSDDATPAHLDEPDQRIIYLVSANPLASVRELARACEMPASTLDDRLQKLITSGIYDRFVQSGRNYPRPSPLSRCIGELDTETGVALDDIHDMKEMLYDLHQVGGGLVRDIVTHSFGEELKGHSRCG